MVKLKLLVLFALMSVSIGCSEKKIVEPNRDDFISGEVETMIGLPEDDDDSE